MKTQQSHSTLRKATAYSPEKRLEMIQVAAYYRAEQHAFDGSSPIDDWLAAEAEIDRIFQAKSGKKLSAKQSFQEKLEAQLKEWDAKLDKLKAEAPEQKGKIRTEFEKQLEALAVKRENANEKLQELRKHTEDAWEDLKDGAENAWTDLRVAMERIASRFKWPGTS